LIGIIIESIVIRLDHVSMDVHHQINCNQLGS
jgi:hypothetical protein